MIMKKNSDSYLRFREQGSRLILGAQLGSASYWASFSSTQKTRYSNPITREASEDRQIPILREMSLQVRLISLRQLPNPLKDVPSKSRRICITTFFYLEAISLGGYRRD